MSKESLAFLFGGFAFGVLIGYGLFSAVSTTPDLDLTGGPGSVGSPAGPMAPGQTALGAGGAAPMVAEINALKGRLQEKPEDVGALMRLANIYHDVSMWEQAITYYDRALELRPDDPDLLTDAGICFKRVGRFDHALELFDKAREVAPDHWQSLFNKVVVAGFDLDRFDLAVAAMEQLEAMNPPPPRTAQLRQALEQRMSGSGNGSGS